MDESWRHCFATWALLLCKPIVANEIDRKKPKLSDQKVSGIGRDAAAHCTHSVSTGLTTPIGPLFSTCV
jgi:hypothetical protein